MELLRALGTLIESPSAEHVRAAAALGLPALPEPAEHGRVITRQRYPHASVYLGAEGMVGGEARDRIAGFRRALGTPDREADHLASLLGLLAALEQWRRDEPGRAKRVLLATIHVPLARVPDLVTAELLVSQTRLLGRALSTDWGIEAPRIALCALNPHASDDGMFGTEERDVYAPALAALSGAPWSVTGPVPADTVFKRAFTGEFDAVVAPYHDVGMAAFKTAAFGRGVNVTIGLPFVRTSPDHGTAFDIAGRGVADPSSMIAAVGLAVGLAGRATP